MIREVIGEGYKIPAAYTIQRQVEERRYGVDLLTLDIEVLPHEGDNRYQVRRSDFSHVIEIFNLALDESDLVKAA